MALYSINQNIKILSYGFYNSPLFNKINGMIKFQNLFIRDGKSYDDCFKYMINLYNNILRDRASEYDFVYYVPLDFMENYCSKMDFHPNTMGNELIAQVSLNIINSEILKIKKI